MEPIPNIVYVIKDLRQDSQEPRAKTDTIVLLKEHSNKIKPNIIML